MINESARVDSNLELELFTNSTLSSNVVEETDASDHIGGEKMSRFAHFLENQTSRTKCNYCPVFRYGRKDLKRKIECISSVGFANVEEPGAPLLPGDFPS
jgi:hypothetical protein